MQVYILLFTTVIIIYLSTIYFKKNCARKLTINVHFSHKRVQEQDIIDLIVEVENKKLLFIPIFKININIPYYLMLVDEQIDESEINQEFYTYKVINSLLCFQKFKKTIKLKPIKRGYYTCDVSANLVDLFGFCTMVMNVDEKAEIFVHPKVQNLEEFFNKSISLQGNSMVKRWINPDHIFYSGVRLYETGDSFKDIDWKATAKLGQFYVKKYDYTAEPSLMIFFDVFSSKDGKPYDDTFIERGISITASIINEAYKDKIPVGFTTNSYMKHYIKNIVLPDNNLNSMQQINDILTCMEYKSWDTFKKTMEKYIYNIMSNNTIIFIKYEMTKYLYSLVTYLIKNNYNVEVLLYKDNGIKLNNNNIKITYFK